MWERLRRIWPVPDLRNKILFTLAMLLVFPHPRSYHCAVVRY